MSLVSSHAPARVLVVDADAEMRSALCAAIQSAPSLRLVGARADGKSALMWLQQERADVLLIDPDLPDEAGLDVIRACAQRHQGLDILVLTGNCDAKTIMACAEAGAAGYLLRNAGNLDVAGAVREIRNGGAPLSPRAARVLLNRIRSDAMHAMLPLETKERLTPRETEILNLLARGESYGEVASILSVSLGTIQTHIKNLYGKLGVHSRSEAVFEAHCRGLLSLGGPRRVS